MTKTISLIVTDTSPLITLAVAGELDTLLLTEARVIIPDMVKEEVIRDIGKPGASEILIWLKLNEPDRVVVGSTTEYEEFVILRSANPAVPGRGRGERAAAEILSRELDRSLDAAILLFEDSDIQKANFLIRVPDNVLIMSTSEYLFGLQEAKLIRSANEILNKAVDLRGSQILARKLEATTGAETIKPGGSRQLKRVKR